MGPGRPVEDQADNLYRQGFLTLKAGVDKKLSVVAKLWQRASELYSTAGEEDKADKIRHSLKHLYKRAALITQKTKKEVTSFREWGTFFKIGCFGFGGPLAVFSLLEDELVRKQKILTDKDFLEGAVLGDILPGPITMDIVSYTGYRLKKWRGAIIATTVFILPSFVLMIILAMLYNKYSITPQIESVFKCLGAAVTGLIISVGMRLGEKEVKDYFGTGILIWAFASSLVFKLDILLVVGLSGLAGTLLYIEDTEAALL